MKPSNGKIPALSAIAVLALFLTFAVEACNLPEPDMASTTQEEVSSSATSQSEASQSKSDSSKEGTQDAETEKREAATPTDRKVGPDWSAVKPNFLNDMTGTALGGWWRMGEAGERLVYLNMDPDYRVYEPDSAAQYGYSLIGEGSIDSMEPTFTPVHRHPFDQTRESKTTFAFSDGTRYVWRKDDQGTLTLSTSSNELFTGELVRMDYATVPFALRIAVARADYSEQHSAFSLADIADPTYVDGLQVLSGTIRVASERELSDEQFGIEPTEPATDAYSSPEIAVLVLDSPTFLEGEHASGYGMVIEAVRTIELGGDGVDWLSMDGRYVTIAVRAENVTHPSDVQPWDAWTSDAELW